MYPLIKRFLDVFIALIATILLTPLFVTLIIILKLTGEKEIFFLQKRVGFKNKHFYIFKFSTMLKDSANMKGGAVTTKKDPRITSLGHFLRRSKINELPQFLNILNGDMSFIGPRPVMLESFAAYPRNTKNIIYNSRPGLSGIGSIVMSDEEKLLTRIKDDGGDAWEFYKIYIFPYKCEVETWYNNNISFMIDIKIILLTLVIIFSPQTRIDCFFKGLPKRNF
jgi:lipopolysaccharide/colanic/teichoic acid biosynthesis glycosyltransferase